MEIDKAKYILNCYLHLLKGSEILLIKRITLLPVITPEILNGFLKEIGWIDSESKTFKYFDSSDNYLRLTNDSFDILVATKIYDGNKEIIFLNYCPKCEKLARTSFAKQCRCGYSWRNDKINKS